MLLKAHLLYTYVETSPSEATGIAPHQHQFRTLVRYAAVQGANLGLSCALLQLLVQPQRAPFAFGGWLCGRGIYLTQDMVELSIQVVD